MRLKSIIDTGLLLCMFLLALSTYAFSGQNSSGKTVNDEEQEIIENLDILESIEMLQDINMYEDYLPKVEDIEFDDDGGGNIYE
ncbi:MAG: hypothetical protein A2X87_06370 [Deltaproteobacteria bacterium GWC2_42_51]|nr:MAG: hypothetical protein A2X87_06370 [Deltaproteobacteria bacterium GWC2_42_51]OGP43797.1 MAG: hypothetical protein A2090_03040 [Deltaproteobacteria bacterium GWD2_42_10]OGP45916.1 MAG: hypothetical protein A2022_05055 [Deltaproteobacteria bacterium GWF2_42_12]OGQ29886.1 MAG: hypothetical protein A3D29_04730 [Deltaproteobacteria bacterium RIFCSPHIGHO2_02_FULL_42_44]OGQ38622.1 MAG: hypothetical protein A3H47_07915 [Deltaproteobacteria bacterium RIFCSPLOWO2_02_FULL_42_39]OGQ65192.1 MAG: hypo